MVTGQRLSTLDFESESVEELSRIDKLTDLETIFSYLYTVRQLKAAGRMLLRVRGFIGDNGIIATLSLVSLTTNYNGSLKRDSFDAVVALAILQKSFRIRPEEKFHFLRPVYH